MVDSEEKNYVDVPEKNVEKLKLEKVLGLTVSCNAGIDCDPRTSNVAYTAGCVIVFQNLRKNKQSHIINSSKKTITSLAYSWDGKYIVTGECGHLPNVRIWDTQEKVQVAEFPGHKYGINCVAFSPNLKYVVSVGSQHDMIVNVWDWKNNVKVASNKVSSKVKAISFSSNGNYFVTVGNRHVKFWYLEYSRSTKYKLEAVPLMGRSAILGEQRNNYFCCVSCGRGKMSDSTFAITKSGLLCEFNSRRLLDKWVELRTNSANCMSVADEYVFVGCADGVVRCFSQSNLHFLTTLPKTHHLGVDVSQGLSISHMGSHPQNAKYPDTVALTYDEVNKKVTCVYNDHSIYTWDVKDLKKIGKCYSYLYHSACIWGIEMYPSASDGSKIILPPGSFITCSSDDTVRIWNLDQHIASDTIYKRNVYSNELLKIIYVDDDLAYLCDMDFNPSGSTEKTDTTYDGKNGVRCIRIDSEGKQLASGDRSGNIHIHDLQFMDEICKIEAHDSEVLCLEYSHPRTGHKFLASASRDRLIHVFDVEKEYSFQQTLDDHSSSITAVRFLQNQDNLMMLSCGADKSVIFRSAQYTPSLSFTRDRHIVGKTTLYDMDVDVSQKHILTACQDRNIRVFNVASGKQSKCFKGTYGEDGTLIKVVLDNSGMFLATSSTDKNLSIHDYYTGECVAATSGHSELVTGLKFTNDCKHLISVSGDGCIFVWKLPSQFTHTMQTKLAQLEKHSMAKIKHDLRRQTMTIEKPTKLAPELSIDKKSFLNANAEFVDPNANDIGDNFNIPGYRFSVGQLPAWAKKQISEDSSPPSAHGNKKQVTNPLTPKGRWAQRIDSQDILLKSVMESESFDESVELRQKNVSETTNIRRETMILSNNNSESRNFSPSINNIKAVKSEMNLRDMEFEKVTKERGSNLANSNFKSMAALDLSSNRTRNLTESSSGTSISKMDDFDIIDTEDHDGDVDSDDSETDTTEPEPNEVIYYPPSGTSDGDSSFRIQASLEASARKSYPSKLSRSVDILNSSTTEDGSEEDEVSTPVDPDRNLMSLLNMSTENLDRIDKRETYMKNNYESLESGEFQNDINDFDRNGSSIADDNDNEIGFNPRHSISAKFLSKSLSTAPSARNMIAKNIPMNKTKDDQEATSKKKQELTRALNDTKKKLESVSNDEMLGWKVESKSVLDLTNVPEKDFESHSTINQRSSGMTRDSMRRACSLTDISASHSSNAVRKRLLPSTPHGKGKATTPFGKSRPHELYDDSAKTEAKYNAPNNQRHSATASLYSRQMSGPNGGYSNPVSRSISMSSLNDVENQSSRSKVHRVPSVHTLNRLNSMKKSDADNKADRSSISLSKSSSNSNLNSSKKFTDRRRSTFELRKAVFETSSSEQSDKSHLRSRTNGKSQKSTNGDRTRATSANRLSKSDSRNSISSSASKSNLSSRSSSERDLSKIARDVTERLSPSTTVTVNKTKHETYTKRNSTSLTTRKSVSSLTVSAGQSAEKKELEKSPQELPVKDKGYTSYRAITQDVYTAPLSKDLCDSLSEDLRQVTSEAMVLFQRVTLDKDLPQDDKTELMNILAQGVWQAQQNLRPAVPPLPLYSSNPTDAISQVMSPLDYNSKGITSKMEDSLDYVPQNVPSDIKSTGNPDAGTMNLLHQYSDMLLSVIQQRMNSSQNQHK